MVCQKARLSRDPRFDGKFFTAVKTTGIYCRTICPVYPPKEENVVYFASAIECATAGFRPCLRCRPDSAPNSPAWKGVNATLDRAIRLIDEGSLQASSLPQLAMRLGISDRYLRQLFNKHLGMSPKSYALYQQCLFAKQLLHQTKLPITEVALASGFESVRRFNDCFKSQLKLTPSALRKSTDSILNSVKLKLYYRPPFAWTFMQSTLATRAIPHLEWCNEHSYGRTFNWFGCIGHFTAIHIADKNMFEVKVELDDIKYLKPIVNNIKRVLDLDVDLQAVEKDLQHCLPADFPLRTGIRLPGIWSMFEAGIRAILGQQISIGAARNLVSALVEALGEQYTDKRLFPTPEAIAHSELEFIKIPGSRKQTLRNLAQHYISNENPNDAQQWLKLKGIGPWTVDYAQMRGLSQPDIFLGGDLGIKKALGKAGADFTSEQASPWRSYLTFQLWSQL
ncbi:MAG: AraC family transcriptional regulator of adaptative response / DNA-3-methyladenine glycosylase II [Alteromonadaceae bacterium]|jgi:AraC family transcriptional regulator of adaptative response / DNA-3-methyladenine glycosylase II